MAVLMAVSKLSETDIALGLAELPGWEVLNGKLHREYRFRSFVEAFAFISACALEAEKMDHHPEWFNVYGQVRIELMTHEISAISSKDLALAKIIEAHASKRVG